MLDLICGRKVVFYRFLEKVRCRNIRLNFENEFFFWVCKEILECFRFVLFDKFFIFKIGNNILLVFICILFIMVIIIFFFVDFIYLSINVKIICFYVGSLLLVFKMRCLNFYFLIEMFLRVFEELFKVIIFVILFFFKLSFVYVMFYYWVVKNLNFYFGELGNF